MLFSNVRLVITVVFWVLIYGGDPIRTLNGFTLSGIITYLVFIDVFGTVVYGLRNSGFEFCGMVKNGSLGPAILKPYNLGASVYFRNLAGGISGMLPQAALVVCALPFAARYLVWEINPVNAVFILLFMAAGTVSCHLLCSVLGYIAFWIEEANAVLWSFAVLLNVMTGLFIPLDFFPEWSVFALEMSPVASWGYIQTKIFIGLYPPGRQIILLITQVLWIGALLPLNALIWKKGVRKFSSVGG